MKKLSMLLVLTMLCAYLCPWAVSAADANVTVTTVQSNVGNIYSAGSQTLCIKYTNTSTDELTKTYKVTVADEDGLAVWSQTSSVTIPAAVVTEDTETYGTTTVTYNPRVDTYGFYTISISENSETIYTDTFSVANLSEGTQNPRMGVVAHLDKLVTKSAGKTIAKNAGLSSFREGPYWHYVEKEEGVYEIPTWNAAHPDNFKDDGMNYLICLDYGNPLYLEDGETWDPLHPTNFPKTEAQRTAFVNFVKYLANEYKTKVPNQVKSYLLWNEPNGKHFNYTEATPEEYTALLKEVYTALKYVDPTCEVIGVALSCGEADGTSTLYEYTDFIKRMLDAGAYDYMDAVSIHPYTYLEARTTDRLKHISRVTELREMIDSYGTAGEKHIYYTECGHNITTTTANVLGSEEWQEDYLIKMYAEALGNNLGEKFWYYDLVCDIQEGDNTEHTFGLVTSKGTENQVNSISIDRAKGSYLTMAGLNKFMYDADFSAKCSDFDGVSAYSFEKASGEDVAVMWADALNTTKYVEIYLGASSIKTYDHYTNETATMSSPNGVYTIPVTTSPVYVTGDFSAFRQSNDGDIEVAVMGTDKCAVGEAATYLVEATGTSAKGTAIVEVREGSDLLKTVELSVPANMTRSALVKLPVLEAGSHNLTFTCTTGTNVRTVNKTLLVAGESEGTVSGGENTMTVTDGVVTVTGTTAANGFVSMVVYDSASNIVEIAQLQADASGNYETTYTLPAVGIYTVKVNNGALDSGKFEKVETPVEPEVPEEPKVVEYSVKRGDTVITNLSEIQDNDTLTVTVNTNGLFEATDDVYCVIYNGNVMTDVKLAKVGDTGVQEFTLTITTAANVTDINVFVWRKLTPLDAKFDLLAK